MKIQSEKGQALLLAMIALLIGAFVIPPFLGFVGTSLIGSRNYKDSLDTQYACDSGAEHAIWNLTEGGLTDIISDPGDMTSYELDETINGETVDVTVSNSWETLAWDNFESGTWSGGGGWLGPWATTGTVSIVTTGTPQQGTRHVLFRASDQSITRSVDLSKEINAHLRFWYKAYSFETGDNVILYVSNDGTTWVELDRWVNGDDDNVYTYRDYDITTYGLTDTFYIRFDANFNDYFYVDNLDIIWLASMPVQIAEDDFEWGGWGSGSGWVGDWTHTGHSEVLFWTGTPHGGWWHAHLWGDSSASNRGYIKRQIDLSNEYIVHLRFWAKAAEYESSDEARCLISSDGTAWTEINDWVNGEDTNVYTYFDLDLSAYNLTDTFWIAFYCNTNRTDEHFYVDDIEVVATRAFCITAQVGDNVIKASVELSTSEETVVCWYYL